MTWSRAISAVCAAVVLGGLGVPTIASEVGPFGGPGGKAFRNECGPGQYLVGLDGRTGAWVDAIGPICARWDASGQSFKDERVTRYHGNLGGAPEKQKCAFDLAIGSVLVDLKRSDDHLVSGIGFDCYGALPPYPVVSNYGFGNLGEFVPLGGRSPVMDRLACPAGELAVGIIGRAGDALDAFGLICGPAPSVEASPIKVPPIRIKVPLPKDGPIFKPGKVIIVPEQAPEAPAPAPESPPASAGPGEFSPPLTMGHERLNACLFLPNDDCGEPAAAEFCQSNGFGDVENYEIEKGQIRSETIYGELCRKNCRVFVSISCGG